MSHDCSISAVNQTSKKTCRNKVTSGYIIQTRNLDKLKSHIYMQWKNSNAKHDWVKKHEVIYLPTAYFPLWIPYRRNFISRKMHSSMKNSRLLLWSVSVEKQNCMILPTFMVGNRSNVFNVSFISSEDGMCF